MSTPLMPKATAVWLIDNTTLTFDQIAAFCNLHPLELQGIADGEVAQGIVGADPIVAGQMTQEELDRCIQDPGARLAMIEPSTPLSRRKGPRYTPVSRRQDRPDAISWLVRFHPELTDGQVSKLVGTTKPTINAVRDRTHWNSPNIKPKDPVALALCSLPEAFLEQRRRGGLSGRRRSRRRWNEPRRKPPAATRQRYLKSRQTRGRQRRSPRP